MGWIIEFGKLPGTAGPAAKLPRSSSADNHCCARYRHISSCSAGAGGVTFSAGTVADTRIRLDSPDLSRNRFAGVDGATIGTNWLPPRPDRIDPLLVASHLEKYGYWNSIR